MLPTGEKYWSESPPGLIHTCNQCGKKETLLKSTRKLDINQYSSVQFEVAPLPYKIKIEHNFKRGCDNGLDY